MWDTTHALYKKVLKDWFKGTCGGSGDSTFFEGWSDEKLTKYDINPGDYDHTDVGARPAILIQGYCTQRIPYLTIIHLWDKMGDYLLSSRHDPLSIGMGEPGISTDSAMSSLTGAGGKSSPNKKKRESPESGLKEVIKSVIDLCNNGGQDKDDLKTNKSQKENLMIENQGLPQLFALIEQHKVHLNFLMEHGMCGDDRKESIIKKIEDIFEIISRRSGDGGGKKRGREIESDSSSKVSR